MSEQIKLTPAQQAFKKELDCYNMLHEFFSQEHGLILTTSEMDDVIKAVDLFKAKFNSDEIPY